MLSLSEQARRLAEKAGVALPCDPDSVELELRLEIARKLGTKRYNVDQALWAAKRLKRTPAELAKDDVAAAERAAKRLLALEAAREARAVQREKQRAAKKAATAAKRAALRAELRLISAERTKITKRIQRAPLEYRKAPSGTVGYEFESQRRPQLPAFRSPLWMAQALLDAGNESRSRGDIVRASLAAALKLKTRVTPIDVGPGGVQLGTTRLRENDLPLLKALKIRAIADGVTISDVIRWALARWLEQNGYVKGK